MKLVEGLEPIAKCFDFLKGGLGFFLAVPEAGVRHLGVEDGQSRALAVDVKDTSATPPAGRSSASDRDCVRCPPLNRIPRKFSCRRRALRSGHPEIGRASCRERVEM